MFIIQRYRWWVVSSTCTHQIINNCTWKKYCEIHSMSYCTLQIMFGKHSSKSQHKLITDRYVDKQFFPPNTILSFYPKALWGPAFEYPRWIWLPGDSFSNCVTSGSWFPHSCNDVTPHTHSDRCGMYRRWKSFHSEKKNHTIHKLWFVGAIFSLWK